MKKDLLTIKSLNIDAIEHLFSITEEMKTKVKDFSSSLASMSLGLIFLKPSLRTRVSFEAGMAQLGGTAFYLSPEDIKFGTREAVKDIGSVLSRYLNGLVVRTFSHQQLEELASYCSIPVINGLTDLLHPCQALSDLFTIKEKKGTLSGIKITFVGDGNNVVHSLLYGCAKTGCNITVATPGEYRPKDNIMKEALEIADKSGSQIELVDDPRKAVEGSDVVYTDVWTSMGKESECEKRANIFKDYQVNSALVSRAKKDCLVMHCLPAHRGEEITDEVIDGNHSVVFDQAENRMHVQKAILYLLLGN